MFNKDCCYKGGRKHNFVGRFSEEEKQPDINDNQLKTIMDNVIYSDTAQVLHTIKIKKKTYIHDICTWCGEIRTPKE